LRRYPYDSTMGWCHEFGPQIHEGCAHPMVAGPSSCTCAECGAVCRGRFNGCPAVWSLAAPPAIPVLTATSTATPDPPSLPRSQPASVVVRTPPPVIRVPPPVARTLPERAAAAPVARLSGLRDRLDGVRDELKSLGDSLGERIGRLPSPSRESR
jgi:hypothetical protein